MCQEDQVALLKGGCTEMMFLRSAMQYDMDHAKWKVSTKVYLTENLLFYRKIYKTSMFLGTQ